MIIGISGKKQHGKDTVAKIIQYLMAVKRIESGEIKSSIYSRQEFISNGREYVLSNQSGWKKRQFAGKLKEMVCMLIDCTMEQLEDNIFKETPLGEEWQYWFASYYKLKTDKNPQGKITGIYSTREELVESLNVDLMGQPFNNAQIESAIHTPRTLLQFLGTDCGRKLIHPNIWINATMSEYKVPLSLVGEKHGYSFTDFPNWIITDVRFPNEARAIHDKLGIVIRVVRKRVEQQFDRTCLDCLHEFDFEEMFERRACPKCKSIRHAGVYKEKDTHPSETALDNYKGFSATIYNNDDGIDNLIDSVKAVLEKFRIL